MKIVQLTLVALLLVGAATESDPLKRIVDENTKGPLWTNGGYPRIDLPKGTPIKDVVAKAMSLWLPDAKYEVVKIKEIGIDAGYPSNNYTAVLLKAGGSDRVMLLQYTDTDAYNGGRWWSRLLKDQPAPK